MKKIFFYITIFQLFQYACYFPPHPVYRLQTTPNEYEKFWLNGREYSKLLGNNYELIIAFDEVYDGFVSFDVEISNNSTEPKIVSEKLFQGYYLDNNLNSLKNKSHQNAIDPEEKILEADKNASVENARYAQESGMKALSSLFELTVDLASIGKEKTKSEIEKENQEDLQEELQDINDENFHANVVSNLSNEKYKWSFTSLRKTTLPPNHSVNGKIFFPMISYGQYLKIVFIEDKEDLNIIFKINKHTVK